jgi:hypothetical protein
VTHRKNQPKTNRHAGPHDRTNGSGDPDRVGVNGHGPASTERGGIPVQRDRAASDDASGATVAKAAGSAAGPGTDREACAEAAPPSPNGHLSEASGKPSESGAEAEAEKIPGGEFPLPADAGEFVEEIHRRADLLIVWQGLLNSKDDKIKQRAVERLTDLHYKGAAGLGEEPQQFIFDMPRPNRD